jgi:hypothetical protein
MSGEKTLSGCPNCKTPLISTLVFRGAEWYCWRCRATYGLLESVSVPCTPAIRARLQKKRLWFDKHAKHIWTAGAKKRGCKKCETEMHASHLMDTEKAAHAKAIKALLVP